MKLAIALDGARIYETPDNFGQLDAYCEVTCGSETKSTRPHNDARMAPWWGETFTFDYSGEQLVTFTIMDREHMAMDNCLGVGTLMCSQVFHDSRNYAGRVMISNTEKSIGYISIRASLYDEPNWNTAEPPREKDVALRVTVKEIPDLYCYDTNQHPYVEVWLEDRMQKTEPDMTGLATPVYNCSLTWMYKGQSHLEFRVMDDEMSHTDKYLARGSTEVFKTYRSQRKAWDGRVEMKVPDGTTRMISVRIEFGHINYDGDFESWHKVHSDAQVLYI